MNELCKLSATEAVSKLKRREISPLDLIDAALARIEETDRTLNAVPTLCIDRARKRAIKLMQNSQSDASPGYLYGLPLLVKDNTHVEGVRCTSGSRIYADRISSESDLIVQRLEQQGALVIGKSNLPEFEAGGTTFNDVFGVTRNPWNARMTPSGSSGGSAVALAAGQAWLATGNDVGGSIRTPSSFCSTVGLRPSPGMVARNQMRPFSALGVEGPMGRNVADCALMFDSEVGPHPLDPMSHPASEPVYSTAASRPVKPRRIAFSVDLGVAPVIHEDVRTVTTAAAKKLVGDGIAVEEAHPDLSNAESVYLTLRAANNVGRLAPLLKQHRELLKPDVIRNAELGLSLSISEVTAADVAHGEIIRRAAKFFETYDLLICPTVLCPPFSAEISQVDELYGVQIEGPIGWLVLTYVLTMTACPVLAIPCGFTKDGLPVGLQIMAPLRDEARLFAHGAYLEQLLGVAPSVPIDPQ